MTTTADHLRDADRDAAAATARAAGLAEQAEAAARDAASARRTAAAAATQAKKHASQVEQTGRGELDSLARAVERLGQVTLEPAAAREPVSFRVRSLARWLGRPTGPSPDPNPMMSEAEALAYADQAFGELLTIRSRARNLAEDLGDQLGPAHPLTLRADALECASHRRVLARLGWLAGELAEDA